MFILCSLFAFFLVYSVSHSLCFFFSSPQGLDKCSFYFFLIFDEDSLHLSLTPFIFSHFCIFIYHVAYPFCFLPLSVSCYLFVFPFSFCHHKLPLSVLHSFHAYVSLVGLNLPFLHSFFFFPSSSAPPSCFCSCMSSMVSSRVCLVSW